MKPLLRIAAALAFCSCFLAGLMIVGLAFSSGHPDSPVLWAVGLLFMGIAFFVGGMLVVAAERLGPKAGGG
jgi:uncharacterized membrane protein YgdD (TMEM256/DUF423 family)